MVGTLIGLLATAIRAPAKNAESDELEDKPVPGAKAPAPSHARANLALALVGPDNKPLDATRFSRGIPGLWAVREFPHVFSLEGKSLFTAGALVEADIPGSITVFCDPDPDAGDSVQYRSACSATVPPGNYSIAPFGLSFEVADTVVPRHPALSIEGGTLAIHTVPVTFRAIGADGASVPLGGFQLFHEKTDLLQRLVDPSASAGTPPAFSSLTLYLPRGLSYRSSMGSFTLDDAGKVSGELAEGVELNGSTFTRRMPDSKPASPAVEKGCWLLSHNLRRVFKRGEAARFDVIVSGPFAGGQAAVVAQSGSSRFPLGRLSLPAVAAAQSGTPTTDSRLFLLDTGALAPGKYELTLDRPDTHGFGFEIVDIQPTTPLLLFTINSCGECDFTLDSAGLEQMRAMGVRCWEAYGFGSSLTRATSTAVPFPSAPADAPAELRRPLEPQRVLLEDSLRHGLVTVDFENRRAGWYNEGLAFHHTHPMSVERMVRRIQIFGQEVDDYPAFAGMSYTWFPSLPGYIEGGVCTDPFFNTRMQLLREEVKQQTGLEPLTDKESERLRQSSGIEQRALADKQRDYWRAEQRLGWGKTLALYDQKLREVRPGLIATMSENAGHDSGKSLADMASAHDGMTFESYTDFGDWPMSAGFVTDWAHGQIGAGKPVWQAVECSQAEPAIVAKQFYKFARGAEGIGNGVHAPTGARSNARRGLTNQFLERYGSLVSAWSPDTRVAVCVGDAQFGEYDAHALHSHLTRLGYGPIILSERSLEAGGVPAGITAVFVPNLRVPFSASAESQLKSFMGRGGKVVLVGEKCEPIEGAVRVEIPLKTLWDVGGFSAHIPFFDEFKKVRPALEKVAAAIGLSPRNGACPEKAVILPSTSGGIQYVTVISSPLEFKDTEFNPVSDVLVKVGKARKVINLVTGAELVPTTQGTVTLDLVSEPVAFLALLDAAPDSVTLRCPPSAAPGDQIQLSAAVGFGAAPAGAAMLQAPVRYTIADSGGTVRATFYRLSNDKQGVAYRLPANVAGDYTVSCTELLTGVTARARLGVRPAAEVSAIAPAASVYLPHPDRLPLFMGRQEEVRVVVEQTQDRFSADAGRIVEALKKAGRRASIQRVSPESYDMYWLHWLPTAADERTMAKIDAGELVGYRGNLRPYISTAKRAMVPEKGGWEDVGPPYILRSDVILFSGGRIADSLGAVSDWTQSANFPGRGQAVLDVCLSPFWADRDALAVVARDDAGRAAAVDRLVALIGASAKAPASDGLAAAPVDAASQQVIGKERVAIETPLKAFVAPALSEALAVSDDGIAAVVTRRSTAVISPQGAVRLMAHSDLPPEAVAGNVFGGAMEVVTLNPVWKFATSWNIKVFQATAGAKGQEFRIPETYAAAGDTIDGWNAGFAASPDARTYFAGRDGGGYYLIDLTTGAARPFDAPAGSLRFYDQTRFPVTVTAARFSPEGRFVAFTLGNHPSGYGALGSPPASPYCTGLCVIDAVSGKPLWSLASETLSDGSLSAFNKCLAVSEGAGRVALIDWDHEAAIFGPEGKLISRKPIFDWHAQFGSNNPKPLRCELSRDGSVAMFASSGHLLITDGNGAVRSNFVVPALCDARLSADGSTVFTADEGGLVAAYQPDGPRRWEITTHGERPRLAVAGANLWIAEGAGNLLTIDEHGKLVRTVHFADVTQSSPAAIAPPAIETPTRPLSAPPTYKEPQTLSVLAAYGAKVVGKWEPAGTAKEAWGKLFYPADGGISLQVPGAGSRLVHFVYRHALAATSVTVAGRDKPRTFVLDLATPEYRVVDLPAEAGDEGLSVAVAPCPGLEIAELSVYSFTFPGANALFIPPDRGPDDNGLDPSKLTRKDADPDVVLDDKDPTAAAKAASGKMKNAAIYANNPDPDQVEGHYLRAAGNPLDMFDGRKFEEGKPSAWNKRGAAAYGSRLLVDLNHRARPRVCATYARSCRQSEVMTAIAVLAGKKSDFQGPDQLAREPRVIAGTAGNSDQFFNAFDMRSVEIEALGVYICSPGDRELGLSEIELYE